MVINLTSSQALPGVEAPKLKRTPGALRKSWDRLSGTEGCQSDRTSTGIVAKLKEALATNDTALTTKLLEEVHANVHGLRDRLLEKKEGVELVFKITNSSEEKNKTLALDVISGYLESNRSKFDIKPKTTDCAKKLVEYLKTGDLASAVNLAKQLGYTYTAEQDEKVPFSTNIQEHQRNQFFQGIRKSSDLVLNELWRATDRSNLRTKMQEVEDILFSGNQKHIDETIGHGSQVTKLEAAIRQKYSHMHGIANDGFETRMGLFQKLKPVVITANEAEQYFGKKDDSATHYIDELEIKEKNGKLRFWDLKTFTNRIISANKEQRLLAVRSLLDAYVILEMQKVKAHEQGDKSTVKDLDQQQKYMLEAINDSSIVGEAGARLIKNTINHPDYLPQLVTMLSGAVQNITGETVKASLKNIAAAFEKHKSANFELTQQFGITAENGTLTEVRSVAGLATFNEQLQSKVSRYAQELSEAVMKEMGYAITDRDNQTRIDDLFNDFIATQRSSKANLEKQLTDSSKVEQTLTELQTKYKMDSGLTTIINGKNQDEYWKQRLDRRIVQLEYSEFLKQNSKEIAIINSASGVTYYKDAKKLELIHDDNHLTDIVGANCPDPINALVNGYKKIKPELHETGNSFEIAVATSSLEAHVFSETLNGNDHLASLSNGKQLISKILDSNDKDAEQYLGEAQGSIRAMIGNSDNHIKIAGLSLLVEAIATSWASPTKKAEAIEYLSKSIGIKIDSDKITKPLRTYSKEQLIRGIAQSRYMQEAEINLRGEINKKASSSVARLMAGIIEPAKIELIQGLAKAGSELFNTTVTELQTNGSLSDDTHSKLKQAGIDIRTINQLREMCNTNGQLHPASIIMGEYNGYENGLMGLIKLVFNTLSNAVKTLKLEMGSVNG